MARFGNIGKQYFDDSGDPLISGKLYFYESGTTKFKDTFADVNLAKANKNPVILSAAGRQPNIFFNGSARVILTASDDVQIEERDPEGATLTGNFDDWNSLTIYNTGDIVVASDNRYYRSFVDNNQGNEPSESPQFWEEVEFIRVWNVSVTYAANATVKGFDGLFYRSLVDNNLGNDPISSPSEWGSPVDISLNPIGAYSETLVAVPMLDIDLEAGQVFTKTLTANSTLTFSNALTNSNSFTLQLSGGDTWAVTWPTEVTKWLNGSEPTLAAISELVFTTLDDGISFTGYLVGELAAP